MTESCRVEGRHPANVILGHDPELRGGELRAGLCGGRRRCLRRRRPLAARAEPVPLLPEGQPSRARRRLRAPAAPRARPLPERRDGAAIARNSHPTVKPLALMRWLVRLLCPPGGVVLDPTVGSGTTGAAAVLEGRRFVGIELEPAYMEIAAARIAHHSPNDARQAEGVPRAL